MNPEFPFLGRLLAPLFIWTLLGGPVATIVAQDRGNTTAQEYGDAVYRLLEPQFWGFVDYNYNHTGIFAGADSSGNGKVLQALGKGYVTHEAFLADQFISYGANYYGAYTLNNRAMSFLDRKSVVATAINLVNAAINYPSTSLEAPVCLVYYGSQFDGTVADISNIRCDGFVEYCYEKNGFRVWRNQESVDSAWSIVFYPDSHNDRPDWTRNPEFEASPWAQRGAPCATGPNTTWGCNYLPPDTKMTTPAVIRLPTYQVTTNGGPGYLDVTIRATDESGIQLIGCIKPGEETWTTSPIQPQHPTSDSYSWTVRITTTGKFYYAAVDNGGNAPSIAATPSVTLTVPPTDTVKPVVTLTAPAGGKVYVTPQTVNITAAAADNIGVARVEFYDGAALKGTDATAPYTYDWSVTGVDNGAHVWTARAYDAAGNAQTSAAVALTVNIDGTLPVVGIASPLAGAKTTVATVVAMGTAGDPTLPNSGLALVEVRVNGGAWQPAVGTAVWSRTVTLAPCGNTIEARSLDKAGNYSALASVSVDYILPNTAPNTPANVSPTTGATGVSATPVLQASPFLDPDCVGDTQAASQWQVLNSAGAAVVADSGTDPVNKLAWVVPAGKLFAGVIYQWHVRYQDSRGAWSSYSPLTVFTTGGPLLTATKQGALVVLKWPANVLGYTLQRSANPGSATWSNVLPAPVSANGEFTVTEHVTNTAGFYRLAK